MHKTVASLILFLALALLTAMAVPASIASDEPTLRVDGRTANGFEDSLTQIRSQLTEPQEARLTMALLKIRLDADADASDPTSRADANLMENADVRARLHGLSYAQIIASAQLDEAASTAAMGELVGDWQLGTMGITGTQAIRLSQDGRLIQPEAKRSIGRNYWYRSGERVGLSFNDGFATLLGIVSSDGTLEGIGTSVQGARWRWTASRATVEADRPDAP